MLKKKVVLKSIKYFIFILISILFISYIVMNKKDFYFLFTIRYKYLCFTILFILLSLNLEIIRFFFTVRLISKTITLLSCYRYIIVGRFLNSFIPHSGLLYRAISFKLRDNISFTQYNALFGYYMWIDFTVSFFIGSVLFCFFNTTLTFPSFTLYHLIVFIFILLITSLVVLKIMQLIISKKVVNNSHKKFLQYFLSFLTTFFKLFSNIPLFLISLIILTLYLASSVIGLHFCFKSIDVALPLYVLFMFVITSKMLSVIFITPGNLGLKEFAYGILSTYLGTGMAEGISISMIQRALLIFMLGFFSLFLVLNDKFAKKQQLSCNS
ncbi:lysylphosphatidylglycerol synthase domain-containing protein [Chlamydiota bacterium]